MSNASTIEENVDGRGFLVSAPTVIGLFDFGFCNKLSRSKGSF